MKTEDLIAKAISLSMEERAMIVESILKSMDPPEKSIEQKWATVANQRLSELRSGNVQAVPGDEVFSKIWDRLY